MSKLTIDALAQEIRRVDGNHSLGAGALSEALMPFISAHLAAQAEWPSDEDVRKACAAHDAYGSGVVETPAMRAALQFVRPQVVDSALLLYAHNHAEKSVGSEGVRFELRFAPLESGGGLRDYLVAASRHAPTKE